MIVLASTATILQVGIGSATVTNPVIASVSWAPTGGSLPSEETISITSNTIQTIVSAPVANQSIVIGSISVMNQDTIAHQCTIYKNPGAALPLYSALLQPGWNLSYSSGGWLVSDSNGAQVTTVPYLKNQANGLLVLDTNAYPPVANMPPYAQLGIKNVLINGDFDFWQRNTSNTFTGYTNSSTYATVSGYVADRWQVVAQDTNCVVSQISFSANTSVPNNSLTGGPDFCLLIDFPAPSVNTAYLQICQRIEDVHTLSGQNFTLSFWAKSDTTANIGWFINQNYGTYANGVGIGSSEAAGSNVFTCNTTWQYYTWSGTMPSISSNTVGTASFINLVAQISGNNSGFNLGAQAANVYFSRIQLEPGQYATPYDKRPYALEYSMCQRYYEKSYPLTTLPGTANVNNGRVIVYQTGQSAAPTSFTSMVFFRETKRVLPTLVGYSQLNGTAGYCSDVAANVDVTANFSADIGPSSFASVITRSGTTGNNVNLQYHWSADAEF
jgi:hypothetical protein